MSRHLFDRPHPNIRRAVGELLLTPALGASVILYEFADRTLDQCLESKSYLMESSMSQHIVKGILAGLAHLHSHDMIHGNLNPQSILLRPRAEGPIQVLLADFGDSPGATTLHYQAPEITLGRLPGHQQSIHGTDGRGQGHGGGNGGCHGPSADIWSAAAIARELLTGVRLCVAFPQDSALMCASRLAGPISEQRWPGCSSCNGWVDEALAIHPVPWTAKRCPWHIEPEAASAVIKMLELLPAARPTAMVALSFSWMCSRQLVATLAASASPPDSQSRPQTAGLANSQAMPVPSLQQVACQCSGNCQNHKIHNCTQAAQNADSRFHPCRQPASPGSSYCPELSQTFRSLRPYAALLVWW
jgi:serine/threonine protein kinase